MSLDINDPNIKTALFNLKDKGSHWGWVLLGYVPQKDVIRVKEEGSGLAALKDELSDGAIFWAYLRYDAETLPKFILISWCGEGVTGTRKALFMSHSQAMEAYFGKSGLSTHVVINARVEEDVDEKDITTKVSKATGAAYDKAQGDKSRFQQASEGAGATFKNVKKAHGLVTKGNVAVKKTEVEIKQDQREEFWQQQRKADEARRQAQQDSVSQARAEQPELLKQREKYWKNNQAKGAKVKKAVENKDYQVSAEEREKFWQQQQQQKSGEKRAAESKDYQVSSEEREKFWQQQQQQKGGEKRAAESKDYQISAEEREKFWQQQQQQKSEGARAVENKDYQVSEEERQRFWEQQQKEAAAAKAAPKAGPGGAGPKKLTPQKVGGGPGAAPPRVAAEAPAPKKVGGPAPGGAPPKVAAKAAGPSPAEVARQKAEEERKRKEAEEAAAAAAAAEEAAAEEAAAAAAAAAAAEEEGGWGAEEEEGWGAEEEGGWAEEEEGGWGEEEEGAWEEEGAAAAEEEGGWAEEEEGGAYPRAQAIGDWQGSNEGDLSLTTGDIIEIWDNQSDPTGWWHGQNVATGAQGYCPSNYLQML